MCRSLWRCCGQFYQEKIVELVLVICLSNEAGQQVLLLFWRRGSSFDSAATGQSGRLVLCFFGSLYWLLLFTFVSKKKKWQSLDKGRRWCSVPCCNVIIAIIYLAPRLNNWWLAGPDFKRKMTMDGPCRIDCDLCRPILSCSLRPTPYHNLLFPPISPARVLWAGINS